MYYFCLTKYSYVRCIGGLGFIANQSNGKQLVYDENGADWLSLLSRQPMSINSLLQHLIHKYSDLDIKEFTKDILYFLQTLKDEGFVLLEKSLKELEQKDCEDITLQMVVPPIKDLTIEITTRCNERCVHCYLPNKLKDSGLTMEISKIKSLVDEYSLMGGTSVTLTGGEALLHNDLIELMRYIYSRNLKIAIYSNLIALTDTQIDVMREVNVSDIQVSLYGVTPSVHDRITGVKGSCNRSKCSIEKLAKACIPIRIACPVMKENKNDIIKVLEYGKKLHISVELELNITPREDKSCDNLVHRLTINEMESMLKQLMEYDHDYTRNLLLRHKNIYDDNFNLAEYLNYPVCTAGHHGLYITADGKVTTCPNLQGVIMGHIETESLNDIWENSKIINKLRTTTESSFRKCISCEASDYCFRCFALNYTETGDYLTHPEYACEVAFLAKNIVENYK